MFAIDVALREILMRVGFFAAVLLAGILGIRWLVTDYKLREAKNAMLYDPELDVLRRGMKAFEIQKEEDDEWAS